MIVLRFCCSLIEINLHPIYSELRFGKSAGLVHTLIYQLNLLHTSVYYIFVPCRFDNFCSCYQSKLSNQISRQPLTSLHPYSLLLTPIILTSTSVLPNNSSRSAKTQSQLHHLHFGGRSLGLLSLRCQFL